MASITLVASGNTGLTGMTISGSYPITNAYDSSSDTSSYARYSISTSTTGYVYLTYDTSDIPPTATIQSVAAKARLRISNTSRVTNRVCQLYTGTTAKGSNTDFSSTSSGGALINLSTGTSWTRSELNDLRMRIGGTGSSSTSSKYIYIYGTEITITYTAESRTVTTTLNGNGTIDPSGTQTMYDGETYNLIIVPTDENASVTATNNGSNITLTAHTGSESISATADSLTTGFSGGSNMAFYTSSSSTGHNFDYAIGHTAASPGSTSSGSGSWTYVKENGSSTNNTGYVDFSFDFSSIPPGSTINSVTVQCYGATESTSESTAHSEITLYSGATLKSTSQKFTSTSNSTITISSPGTWTRDELQSAKLRFVVGYYGGHIFGITWTVSYTPPKYYTYSYTVSGDATIAVVIGGGGSQPKFYIKINGTWTQVSKIYKKVNGSWVEQSSSTWSTLFDTNTNYRKMN